MFRILAGGFLCGVAAVLLFRQGTVFVLYHQAGMLHALFDVPLWMRPPSAGFSTHITPPLWMPEFLYLCFWGGGWGMALVAMTAEGRAPDLLTGALLGGVVITSVGFANEPGALVALNWSGSQAETWVRPAIINAAWGWGAAGLMRSFGLLERNLR